MSAVVESRKCPTCKTKYKTKMKKGKDTRGCPTCQNADVAQSVEHQFSKLTVAGSTPVIRS